MADNENRTEKLIRAANKAISKMTDPAKRRAARAKIRAVQKKAVEATRQRRLESPQRQKDRDADFER